MVTTSNVIARRKRRSGGSGKGVNDPITLSSRRGFVHNGCRSPTRDQTLAASSSEGRPTHKNSSSRRDADLPAHARLSLINASGPLYALPRLRSSRCTGRHARASLRLARPLRAAALLFAAEIRPASTRHNRTHGSSKDAIKKLSVKGHSSERAYSAEANKGELLVASEGPPTSLA
ncbi:hypothetical protein PHSY_004389 [Pseudozyma hubeiensis SY62]|uniref:Uncharacterized protein n=1 Tax=Pseudozyma hubeiensis (strain SY62) TaxID=1305764 RepID=R9PFF7_PSEHS|nr:hypothetical protein PHSY_004389 [Pseudozyma hubeiensis SY62]GAC96805.1 hypothetical protein PHSY_004389 [Pseudozyma hubeiensis SY62]